MKNRAVSYCRVSTLQQRKSENISLQISEISEYAKRNNIQLVGEFKDDGVSGAKDTDYRTGLSELLEYLKENAEVKLLIIWKLDRLFRDISLQELFFKDMTKQGIRVISLKEDLDNLDDDPARKMVRQLLGVFAEYERAMITMRLKAGKLNKIKRSGGFVGGCIPLGYRVENKQLVIDEEKAELIKKIFWMKRRKKMSINSIAKQLTNDTGKKWYAGTVYKILNNKKYTKGEISYSTKKEVVKGQNSRLAFIG